MGNRPVHKVRLAGTTTTYTAEPRQSLLFAGLAAGIPLPYECNSGTCGSCKAVLRGGQIEDRYPSAPGLSARDRRKGRVLLCQAEPRSDVEVKVDPIPTDEEPRPQTLELVTNRVRRLGPTMLELELTPVAPIRFLAGQYLLLKIPGVGRRAYSMANAPIDDSRIDLLIKAVPGGAATKYFFEHLASGTVLEAEGPLGRAYLRNSEGPKIRCVAGGSGLAPVLSIARAALGAGRKVDLYYGARCLDDLVYLDVLADLQREHEERAEVITCLSEPRDGDEWTGATGNVGDVLFSEVSDLTQTSIYMAGPPAMVDAVLGGCVLERGVPADRIYFDRFY